MDAGWLPKKENAGFAAGAGAGAGVAGFALGSEAPKKEKLDFLEGAGTGLGAGAGAGVDLLILGVAGEKKEKDGVDSFLVGAGLGAGALAAFVCGAGEKNENAGVVFFVGAGAGADTGAGAFGSGFWKIENVGEAAFFTGAGDGAGTTCFGVGVSFLDPKNAANASVTGSEMSISAKGVLGFRSTGLDNLVSGDDKNGMDRVFEGIVFVSGFFVGTGLGSGLGREGMSLDTSSFKAEKSTKGFFALLGLEEGETILGRLISNSTFGTSTFFGAGSALGA